MEGLAELLGESPSIESVREKLRRLVQGQLVGQRLPAILIQGETGTGKGLLARLVHRIGPRRNGPFVDINCPAIPETMLEAELFGYERGAFTDARRAKPGLFQAAHNGTLFLDEVGLLAASVQAKLLGVLEGRAVRRLGSTKTEAVDVCVISATNTDLAAALPTGRFRDDLYHRLAVIRFDMPPLRDRGRDVVLLAERFLARAGREYGLTPKRFSEEAKTCLLAYQWPGNVRELANVVERAVLLAESALITGAMLELPAEEKPGPATQGAAAGAGVITPEQAMRRYLQGVLEDCAGNISHAASRLGIARNTLYARLERYGLSSHDPSPRRRGRPQRAPVSAPTGTWIEWERRGITLLCVAFTEGIRNWSQTTRALDGVIDKLQAFGGRVEELTPTGVVVSFGVNRGEDGPRRAAHAAMVVHRMAGRGDEDRSRTSGVRIGIHVAQVLVGRSGTLVGIDADAKRANWPALDKLLKAARANETIASATAAPFLERRFELVPIEDGEGGSVVLYRLTGEERRGLGLWGAMTQFVGREDEIEVLRRHSAEAWHGRGQFVAVVGEPGIGKSRLIWEFAHSRHVADWLVLESGGLPHGMTTPYLPVVELLKAYFHIEGRDEARAAREKVTSKVLRLDRALEPHLPGILSLLEIPGADEAWSRLDPPERRRRTLDAVTLLLLRESQVQPLVMVFEDLHWVDAETEALLDRLVVSLPSARMLLLANYRPEYRHRSSHETCPWLLRLNPLQADSARGMLSSLIGVDARLDEIKRSLVERTGGNPLFLEESVRTLVENETLTGERGAYRLKLDAISVQMPGTVESILAGRIDRLAPKDKRLLHAASAIGKDVPLSLLVATTDLTEENLLRGLARLQEADLVFERSIGPDLGYTFKHALTHEVAYGGMLPDQRRELHARIVAAIEGLYGGRLGEHIERLAHHAIRGEVWEKALRYGRQMGDRGAARRAYGAAMMGYEQSLEALGHLADSDEVRALATELRRALALVLAMHGEHEKSLRLLDQAEVLARRFGDRVALARLLSVGSYVRRELGDLGGAVAAGQEALAIGVTLADPVLRADAVSRLAQAVHTTGDFRLSAQLLRTNLGTLSSGVSGRSRALLIGSEAWLARSLASIGEFLDGGRHGQNALRLAMEDGEGPSPVTAHGCLGILYVIQGEWAAAISLLERGLALCHAADDRNWSQAIAGALGEAYGRVGRLSEALALVTGAFGAALDSRALSLQCLHTRQLSVVYLLAGQLDEAQQHVVQALDLARRMRGRGFEANALAQLANVQARAAGPDLSQAGLSYREAMALAEPRGMRPLIAHCHLGLGTLHRQIGEAEQARKHLATAATLYGEMEMRFWMEEAVVAIKDLT